MRRHLPQQLCVPSDLRRRGDHERVRLRPPTARVSAVAATDAAAPAPIIVCPLRLAAAGGPRTCAVAPPTARVSAVAAMDAAAPAPTIVCPLRLAAAGEPRTCAVAPPAARVNAVAAMDAAAPAQQLCVPSDLRRRGNHERVRLHPQLRGVRHSCLRDRNRWLRWHGLLRRLLPSKTCNSSGSCVCAVSYAWNFDSNGLSGWSLAAGSGASGSIGTAASPGRSGFSLQVANATFAGGDITVLVTLCGGTAVQFASGSFAVSVDMRFESATGPAFGDDGTGGGSPGVLADGDGFSDLIYQGAPIP